MTKREQDHAIRRILGHNGDWCRVVIHAGGSIERWGATDPTDRTQDHWSALGCREDYLRCVDAEGAQHG